MFGFTIRNIDRRLNDRPHAAPALRRSVEQLTELVGRMTLKEIVRETTDLIERLCIEAALELTKQQPRLRLRGAGAEPPEPLLQAAPFRPRQPGRRRKLTTCGSVSLD